LITTAIRNIFLLAPSILLIGCDAIHQIDSTQPVPVETSPPTLLRIIPPQNLVARVTINNGEETVFSVRNFPDGRWQIPVSLIPFENNQVSIKWFELELLLLEERGEVYANPNEPIIKTDFDFITSGRDAFDVDCDGISNLDERFSGTDPFIAEEGLQNGCVPKFPENPEIVLGATPFVNKYYQPFFTYGIGEPIRSISQDVQARTVPPDSFSASSVHLYTLPDAEQRTDIGLGLAISPDVGRYVQLTISNGSASEITTTEGVECSDFGAKTRVCTKPYDWRELRWYTLELREISRASQRIGTIVPYICFISR